MSPSFHVSRCCTKDQQFIPCEAPFVQPQPPTAPTSRNKNDKPKPLELHHLRADVSALCSEAPPGWRKHFVFRGAPGRPRCVPETTEWKRYISYVRPEVPSIVRVARNRDWTFKNKPGPMVRALSRCQELWLNVYQAGSPSYPEIGNANVECALWNKSRKFYVIRAENR